MSLKNTASPVGDGGVIAMFSQYTFIPGLELNTGFFHDIVKPLLTQHFPQVAYSAAFIGYGSDVLGVDTAISMDHNWGPRLQIFLAEHDFVDMKSKVDSTLRENLPVSYKGFPTNFSDKRVDFTQSMQLIDSGPVNHLIEILTIPEFVNRELGIDLSHDVTLSDWLAFPEQGLIELTTGAVFHDGLNVLNHVREQFAFFPHDVWLLKMAALWHAIGEEEAFIGRNHDLGDTLGAHLISARIIKHLMKLCFYLERRYIPYSKWFGAAFKDLNCASELAPVLADMLKAEQLHIREARLAEAYTIIGHMHNALCLTEHIDFRMRNYYGRPYQVISAPRIVEQLQSSIQHATLKTTNLPLIGIDLLIDGVDIGEYKQGLRELIQAG